MIEVFGEKYYTTKEVADMFHVSTSCVGTWATRGKIGRRVIGGRAYYSEEAIKNFFANSTATNRDKSRKGGEK